MLPVRPLNLGLGEMMSSHSKATPSGGACDLDKGRALSALQEIRTDEEVGRFSQWAAAILLAGAMALAYLVNEPPWASLHTVALGVPRLVRRKMPVCWTGYRILSSLLEKTVANQLFDELLELEAKT